LYWEIGRLIAKRQQKEGWGAGLDREMVAFANSSGGKLWPHKIFK